MSDKQANFDKELVAHRLLDMSGFNFPSESAKKIAADLDATRASLAKDVADLESYLKPAQVASRGMQKVTDFFVDENGQVKPERLAIAGVALLGLIGLLSRDRD